MPDYILMITGLVPRPPPAFFACMKKIPQTLKAGDKPGDEAIIITADWSTLVECHLPPSLCLM